MLFPAFRFRIIEGVRYKKKKEEGGLPSPTAPPPNQTQVMVYLFELKRFTYTKNTRRTTITAKLYFCKQFETIACSKEKIRSSSLAG